MNPPGIDTNESVAHRSSWSRRLILLQQYALAVLSVGIALGASLLLEHFHFQAPAGLLLVLAIATNAWYGKRGPALLSLILAVPAMAYFLPPRYTFAVPPEHRPYFITFTILAVLVYWFGTIRRGNEKDLRERVALLNLTHDTVFVMDMQGVIKYWNRGAEERYGWTVEQAVGRIVHDLLKTLFPTPAEEIKSEVMRTGRWEGELTHTKKTEPRC